MSDLDKYDPETVEKALYLQAKIYYYGLEPMLFSEVMEKHLADNAADVLRKHIRRKK